MEERLLEITAKLDLKTRCLMTIVFDLTSIEGCSGVRWPADKWLNGEFADKAFVRANAEKFEGDADMRDMLRALQLADTIRAAHSLR
jgi:hypothetical protein